MVAVNMVKTGWRATKAKAQETQLDQHYLLNQKSERQKE